MCGQKKWNILLLDVQLFASCGGLCGRTLGLGWVSSSQPRSCIAGYNSDFRRNSFPFLGRRVFYNWFLRSVGFERVRSRDESVALMAQWFTREPSLVNTTGIQIRGAQPECRVANFTRARYSFAYWRVVLASIYLPTCYSLRYSSTTGATYIRTRYVFPRGPLLGGLQLDTRVPA